MAKNKSRPVSYGIQGATFGLTEAVIMMMGVLYALFVTGDKKIIILGILASGIADAFANSSAFHISEESENIHTKKEVWKSTILCFLGTILPVALFAVPLFLLPVYTAVVVNGLIGLAVLAGIGYFVGMYCAEHRPLFHVFEYVAIGIVVPIVSYGAGKLIISFF